MEGNNTSTQEVSSVSEDKFSMDFAQLSIAFDSKHLIGTIIVFCGTIMFIVGGAIYCWYRYFRNHEENNEETENTNSGLPYDPNLRRDTLVLNFRRMSRRISLFPNLSSTLRPSLI